MPVATATKVEALAKDFGSQRRLAGVLGVSPAQITRWMRGGGVDTVNAHKVDELEGLMAHLLRMYEPSTALKWLEGANPLLRSSRPIDLIRAGRFETVRAAILQELAGSYA